ncbi:MAG TPA: ROK family protein [Longimicrobiales bacterium]|nr:ROK family protein [Longimicrobiales bacterium]
MASEELRLGLDLGGTKIEGIALEPGGRELGRLRIDTPREYEETLAALEALVRRLEETAGGRGTVGLGIPGTISSTTGLVKNANSTWLIGRPLDRDLAERLGRPVRVANDANCFALSESVDGAGSGERSVFGVILGTGVGGGIVIDGRVLVGAMGVAGEWGHNPLPWPRDDERPGPPCYCGKNGCIETFLSGPGMRLDHRNATGRDWTTRAIGDAAGVGDPGAVAARRRYVDRLARGLATVIDVLDPHVVVLGGGLSNLGGLAEEVQAALPEWVFTDEVLTRVRRNLHGDSSGVRGAAWLWGREGA